MKPFLLIRNSGLAPIESFTILGLSTARGEAEKIGQFGSGSKHGILALMRAGITPIIFIGTDQLIFSTHPAKMNDKDYQEVRYTFRGEEHKTGMCLEFGALDWDSPAMALREFICNALDQGEKIHECTALADLIEAKGGETRVYVPNENEKVRDYWQKLRQFFLHFDGLEHDTILPARSENAQFFRRGVFVTERLGAKSPALFAYNFQNERIDESRNMDGAAMSNIAGKLLRKSQPHLEQVMRTFSGAERWEHGVGHGLYDWLDDAGYEPLRSAWKVVFGSKPYAWNGQISLALIKKGIPHVLIPPSWRNALSGADVDDGEKLLSMLDTANADECEATETATETFQRCWRWLELARLTNGKPFPEVKCFSQPTKDGAEIHGYYKDGTVFLNLEHDASEQTALEELSHYITGAQDETRDFQDFAFKLAVRLAKLRILPIAPQTSEPPPAPIATASEPATRTAYFTFGQGHEHALAGKTYGRNDVVKITGADPRARMVELFGLKWAFEYETIPKMEYYPNGITDLSE